MKKILAIISLALVVATLACLLSSCGAAKLKGTWLCEEGYNSLKIEFKSGGKGTLTEGYYDEFDTDKITYKVKGKKLSITSAEHNSTLNFKYELSGDTLTLTDDHNTYVFKKVK